MDDKTLVKFHDQVQPYIGALLAVLDAAPIPNVMKLLALRGALHQIEERQKDIYRDDESEIQAGTRHFKCSCGETWDSESRDISSPSGEECSACEEWVTPHDRTPAN